MFCTRSRKKIRDGTSFFDPAPPATGYQEREMDPLRSRSAPPIRFDQAFRSKQRRFSRVTRPRGYRRQDRKIGPWHAGYARGGRSIYAGNDKPGVTRLGVEGMERSYRPTSYLGFGRVYFNIAASDAPEPLIPF